MSTQHLALSNSPDFLGNRRSAVIPRYRVSFVTTWMETLLLLVRKLTWIPILNFWRWKVLLGLNGALQLFSSRSSSKRYNIGSSYISDHPILLPNKTSMSKIYHHFLGTRQLLTYSATFWDTCINLQNSTFANDKETTFGTLLETTLSLFSVTPMAGKANNNPKCVVRPSMRDWWLPLLKLLNKSSSSRKARRVSISA